MKDTTKGNTTKGDKTTMITGTGNGIYKEKTVIDKGSNIDSESKGG